MSGATSSGCDTFVFGHSRKLSTQVLRCRRWLPLVDTALVKSSVLLSFALFAYLCAVVVFAASRATKLGRKL